MKKRIYFTFRTGDAGVTDMLTQFSAWYKLGRSLGYQYVHPPMDCRRSGPRILEFLGFDAIWKDNPAYPGSPDSKIELPWFSRHVRFPRALRFTRLRWFVQRRVREAAGNVRGDSLLIEFRLGDPADRGIIGIIERAVPYLPDGIDLRQNYFAHRAEDPRSDLFESETRRILVHIRQGDQTALPTPWGTYLAVRSIFVSEFPSLAGDLPDGAGKVQRRALMSLQSYIDPHDYFSFLQDFLARNDSGSCSTVVSSDGFALTFKMINKAATELSLSAQHTAQLAELEASCDRVKFQEFESLKNTRLLVGETEENLFDLIHAALTADVIVTAEHQWMMMKLLALYGRKEKPPMLVVLTNRSTTLGRIRRLLRGKVSEVVGVNKQDLERAESASTWRNPSGDSQRWRK